jgi:hypothetical protein
MTTYSASPKKQPISFGVRQTRSWGADERTSSTSINEHKNGDSTIQGTVSVPGGISGGGIESRRVWDRYRQYQRPRYPKGQRIQIEVEIVDAYNGQTISSAIVDEDGYYEVSVPDGHYHVTAGATSDGYVWETKLTSVSAEISTVNFDLDKAGSISMVLPATASRTASYDVSVESYSASMTSSAQKEGQTYPDRGVTSYATSPFVSKNSRTLSLVATVSSYASPIRSSSVRDGTTLDVQNQILTWDSDNAEWYTEWFQQPRIVDSEDTLSVRSLVSDYVEQTEIAVQVEYDADGNGKADKVSELVELGSKQKVKEVQGIPVDEDGFYRIKITEYSGYYSIYGLNLAVTH